jgi:hypothetical protein
MGLVALALIAAVFGADDPAGATRWPPRSGLYAEASQSPFALAAPPTTMVSVNAAGDGYDDLVIGSAVGKRVQLLEMRAGRIDGVRSRAAANGPVAMAGNQGSDEVLVVGGGEARIFDFRQYFFRKARIVPLEAVAVGEGASAVLAKEVALIATAPDGGVEDRASPDYVVASRTDDEVLLIDRDWHEYPLGRHEEFRVITTVSVGDGPVAMAGIEGAPGYFYVANAASGTLTQLNDFIYDGIMRSETIPVGGEPIAIALGDFIWGDYRDHEIAVADRARDQVALLDSRRNPTGGAALPYEVVARYGVGNGPVDLLAGDLDEGPGKDLAVVNALSGSVSVLLGTGTGFVPGGTYPAGRHPVAIEPTGYGRYFDGDLAVANRGSRDLTILVRNEFGRCQGRSARLRIGTADDDRLGGENGPNETDGMGGDDVVFTGPGGDCIRGGDGQDLLLGGASDDVVWPGRGEDRVEAQSGGDVVYADGGGRDVVDCGKGIDTAYADAEDVLRECERRP